ncbi:hypothetical protein C4K40_3668 [Pseudomonas sp. CMR5c]|nr:hypothetical protein C4K40_3668 [Pseudomonas sp. CMR5c]
MLCKSFSTPSIPLSEVSLTRNGVEWGEQFAEHLNHMYGFAL